MSTCNDHYFLTEIDNGLLAYMEEAEPSDEFIRTALNVRLLAREIVNQGGFPDGTSMKLHFIVDPDTNDVEIEFTFIRKGIHQPCCYTCSLAHTLYAEPECFTPFVKEMQETAIALRESQWRCN